MKKILSIDGGGIRGIIPAEIIKALENIIQKKTKSDKKIIEYFDFAAGTSTGGILTSIYLCPKPENPLVPNFSAQDALNFYIEFGKTVFDRKFLQDLIGGLTDELYDKKKFESYLLKFFKDVKLSELLKPCLITSYDTENRAALFFTQIEAKQDSNSDFFVRDICRATSAAPTYFEPVQIKNMNGDKFSLIDGGVFANDPTLCAYSEVRKSKGSPTAKDMFILSLSTGNIKRPYKFKYIKDYGKIEWIKPLIDILMSASSETTKYHLSRIFEMEEASQNYIRIEPANLGLASPEIDNVTDENIEYLQKIGFETVKTNYKLLNTIADILIEESAKGDKVDSK